MLAPAHAAARPPARLASALVLTAITLACGGCPGTTYVRPYTEPSASDVLNRMVQRKEQAMSFQADTQMDYWLGDERVNTGVLVMGKRGARIRLNALMPNGDSVGADLACDGFEFRFVDFNRNCQLTGPCNGDSIAQLLHVSLEPDDFLLLALGSTPVIENATGEVTWDADRGYEIVALASADGQWHQRIVFDGRESRWDVLKSEVRDARGNVQWTLENFKFSSVTDESGVTLRVPGVTHFVQPSRAEAKKADLVVKWKKRKLNGELADDKFELSIPEGLQECR